MLPQADSAAAPLTPGSLLQAAADSVRAAASADSAASPSAADTTSAWLDALAEAKKSAPLEAVSGVTGRLVEGLHDATGLSRLVVADLLWTGVVIVALWAVRWLVLALVYRRTRDVRVRYQWRKSSSYVTVVLGAFLLLRIWVGALGSLATFLGLLTAGIAIALKDPLANLAGWLYLVWRRPLAPGDRITIRAHTGDVIDQRVFMFTLLEVGTKTGAEQSTGRLIHVPNGWVFTDSIVNFTRGFQYVWNEVTVMVSFESDWRAAKQLLLGIAAEHTDALSEDAERKLRRAAQEYMIFYSKLTPTVYTSVQPHGVELTLRYLAEPRRQRGSEQQIWEAVLDAFAAHDGIDFAYPTQRLFYRAEEGKTTTAGRPPSGNGPTNGLGAEAPPVPGPSAESRPDAP